MGWQGRPSRPRGDAGSDLQAREEYVTHTPLRASRVALRMGAIVSIHSYRGGTGKSNLTANLAYLLAKSGRRIGVIDTDLQSPGVHVILGLAADKMAFTLSDYLFGKCDLEEAAHNLSKRHSIEDPGALFLLPSSMRVDAIVRIASDGYDVSKLNDQFTGLIEHLQLDALLIDTHPGLNRETMLTTAISDVLALVVRPDQQDFHGTAVLLEVAGKLGVPHTGIIANKVPSSLSADDVKQRIEEAFSLEVMGLLTLSEEMAVLGSRSLFVNEHPNHPITKELERVRDNLLAHGIDNGRDGRN